MGAAGRRKRLRKSLKLFHSRQGETDKISQRLIQVAQPYLNGEDHVDEYRKELSLASTAWNLSLFPPDSREENMMKSLDLQALGEQDRELIATSPRVGATERAAVSRGSASDREGGCARRGRLCPGSGGELDLTRWRGPTCPIRDRTESSVSRPCGCTTGFRSGCSAIPPNLTCARAEIT